jgi:hypothetical protein
LRDAIALRPGPVELSVVGDAIMLEVPESDIPLVDKGGLLVIGSDSDVSLTDDEVREWRLGLQQR